MDRTRERFMSVVIEHIARAEGSEFLAAWMPLDEGYRARFRERYGLDRDRWENLMLTAPTTLRNWALLSRRVGIPTRRLMGAMWAARAARAGLR